MKNISVSNSPVGEMLKQMSALSSGINLIKVNSAVLIDPYYAAQVDVVRLVSLQNYSMLLALSGDQDPFYHQKQKVLMEGVAALKAEGKKEGELSHPYCVFVVLKRIVALMSTSMDTSEDGMSFDNHPKDVENVIDALTANSTVRPALKRLDNYTRSFIEPTILNYLYELE